MTQTKHGHVLVRAVETVAFLFAAFSGFLREIAPPEDIAAGFSAGIASFIALCIMLLLSSRTRRNRRTTERRFWITLASVLTAVALASALCYAYNRERLTFSYPPENPQAEYLAGTRYTPAAQRWADATGQSASEIVAKFGGLAKRNRVWSDSSVMHARLILVSNYLMVVLSIMAAIFSLIEFGVDFEPARKSGFDRKERSG